MKKQVFLLIAAFLLALAAGSLHASNKCSFLDKLFGTDDLSLMLKQGMVGNLFATAAIMALCAGYRIAYNNINNLLKQL